ncbi:hypothetical protein ACTPEF_26120, partial [Clostridioides difficile]
KRGDEEYLLEPEKIKDELISSYRSKTREDMRSIAKLLDIEVEVFSFQGTMPHKGGEIFCLYLSPFLYRVPLLPFQFRQYIRRDTV